MKQFTRDFLTQRAPALARLAMLGVVAMLVMLYAGGRVAWATDVTGDFAVSFTTAAGTPEEGKDYTYTGQESPTLTIKSSEAITIGMAEGADPTTSTIVLGDNAGATTNITLNSVNIAASSGAAITVASGTTANITLEGDNIVKSGSGCAGISTTGTNGNAFIVASSIADESSKGSWSGVIITQNGYSGDSSDTDNGYIYGTTHYTLLADATIPDGYTLTVEDGKYFTVPSGVVFTVGAEGCFKVAKTGVDYHNQTMPAGTYPALPAEPESTPSAPQAVASRGC